MQRATRQRVPMTGIIVGYLWRGVDGRRKKRRTAFFEKKGDVKKRCAVDFSRAGGKLSMIWLDEGSCHCIQNGDYALLSLSPDAPVIISLYIASTHRFIFLFDVAVSSAQRVLYSDSSTAATAACLPRSERMAWALWVEDCVARIAEARARACCNEMRESMSVNGLTFSFFALYRLPGEKAWQDRHSVAKERRCGEEQLLLTFRMSNRPTSDPDCLAMAPATFRPPRPLMFFDDVALATERGVDDLVREVRTTPWPEAWAETSSVYGRRKKRECQRCAGGTHDTGESGKRTRSLQRPEYLKEWMFCNGK